jgi:hypothetical protein
VAVIALVADKGSPGVTTSAIALGAVWPRPVLVAECDQAGGDLVYRLPAEDGGMLNPARGLLSLAATARRGLLPMQIWEHTQRLVGGLDVLVGLTSAEQAQGLTWLWSPLGRAFSRLPSADQQSGVDILVDCGRLGANTPLYDLLHQADIVLILTRPTLEQVAHLRERVNVLTRELGGPGGRRSPLCVAVIADPREFRRSIAEVGRIVANAELPATVLGGFALDPKGAEMLRGQWGGRLDRSLLIRSARKIAGDLISRLAALAPPADHPQPQNPHQQSRHPQNQLPPSQHPQPLQNQPLQNQQPQHQQTSPPSGPRGPRGPQSPQDPQTMQGPPPPHNPHPHPHPHPQHAARYARPRQISPGQAVRTPQPTQQQGPPHAPRQAPEQAPHPPYAAQLPQDPYAARARAAPQAAQARRSPQPPQPPQPAQPPQPRQAAQEPRAPQARHAEHAARAHHAADVRVAPAPPPKGQAQPVPPPVQPPVQPPVPPPPAAPVPGAIPEPGAPAPVPDEPTRGGPERGGAKADGSEPTGPRRADEPEATRSTPAGPDAAGDGMRAAASDGARAAAPGGARAAAPDGIRAAASDGAQAAVPDAARVAAPDGGGAGGMEGVATEADGLEAGGTETAGPEATGPEATGADAAGPDAAGQEGAGTGTVEAAGVDSAGVDASGPVGSAAASPTEQGVRQGGR